jgi:hypothetical protein
VDPTASNTRHLIPGSSLSITSSKRKSTVPGKNNLPDDATNPISTGENGRLEGHSSTGIPAFSRNALVIFRMLV